ncbi:MAG: HAMP domain-containing histidine kinase [Actinomycetota bacterium]|nr:HAMP domain-containing histidine kinase [Actinomycetota bacterium]
MTAASLRRTPLARVYLVAGLAATGLYFMLPWNSPAQWLLYDLIGAGSAAAVVVGTRRHRPALSAAWYLFAAGLMAFAVGDFLFNFYARIWHRDLPIPSVADVFYLAGYPLLAVGLVLLMLRMLPKGRREGLIDAALLTVAFGICHWIFVMHPLVTGSSDWVGQLVTLSYPATDVLLLAALVFLALTPARRTVSYRYLTASIVLLLVADEVYSISPGIVAGTSWLDAGWLLSYVLWGTAALSPSMRDLSEPRRPAGPSLSSVRLLVLWIAVATVPVILIVERLADRRIDAVALAIASAALSGLVLIRLAGLVRSFDRVRRDERAARAEALSAHRQLLRQNEQLRKADRLKDEFVALISHDLRTPLTSIMGYLELVLDDDNLTEEQRGFLNVADRNADRLLRLVNDLLFVARFEAGQLELRPTELDLAAVVRQSVEESGPRAAAGGVELTCEAGEVSSVQADKGRMFQLVDNLVSNAIKFTPEGGDVRVSVTPVNGVVRLEVADTGVGIAPEEQDRLFERFFRASTASEHQIPGTGLGLYITRAIVEAHGGSIAVRSDPGEGTSFCVELPARPR